MSKKLLPFNFLPATKLSTSHTQPYSLQYKDIYFNTTDGLAETEYVFIQSNQLTQRWQHNKDAESFNIAETGFGTGLNFLAVLEKWQQCKVKPKNLHFISVEKFPLSHKDLTTAHLAFPSLVAFSQQLLDIWKTFTDRFRWGWHHLDLPNNVRLSVGFGDATLLLKQLNAQIDAWFLDGFSPNKNIDMWSNELIEEVGRLSHHGTTVATFTAASHVRKHLVTQGFTVTKKPGFGRKREMITAVYQGVKKKPKTPPWAPLAATVSSQRKITILGAGIAGLSLAYHFKQAGFHTTIIEKSSQPMRHASGNQLAMVMPLLTAKSSPESLFYNRAFEYALRFYQANEFHGIGVKQRLTKKDQNWARNLSDAALPSSLIQINSQQNTALYPQAGYIDTQKLAKRLVLYADEWVHLEINNITQQDHVFKLFSTDQDTPIEAENLVIANGINAQKLGAHLNIDWGLTAKHGMTTVIEQPTKKLEHIQLADGYIIPNQETGQWVCGATFDHIPEDQWDKTAELYPDHWQRNRDLWQQHDIFEAMTNINTVNGHAAIRATTKDHLPLCGPCVNQTQFKHDYADLHHGRHWQKHPDAALIKNLYILNGLGSRGFTSAPLLAKYLCAMITGEPLPLEADLCKIIHPNRFLFRSMKKPN